jgi:hypothetical protein
MRTEEQDDKLLKNIDPQETCSDCLDESKVKKWYEENVKSFPYNGLSANCADATAQAMAAGLQQDKPSCPGTCSRFPPYYYTLEDRLSTSGIMTPGRAKDQLESIKRAECNRYYCKLHVVLVR